MAILTLCLCLRLRFNVTNIESRKKIIKNKNCRIEFIVVEILCENWNGDDLYIPVLLKTVRSNIRKGQHSTAQCQ